MRQAANKMSLAQMTRVCQIVVVTMLIALCVFVGATFALAVSKAGPPNVIPIYTYVCLFLAAILLPASVLGPKLIVAVIRTEIARANPGSVPQRAGDPFALNEEEAETLFTAFRTQLSVGIGMLHGIGYLAAIAYLFDRREIAIAIAIAMIVATLARIPTLSGMEQWADSQREKILHKREELAFGRVRSIG